ncbi:MAG: NTP transferase domain-containing protein, partial [Chloroflexota bacterium]|nr:NTP transferase domain-containing protein [Chloroflexota bacterium]
MRSTLPKVLHLLAGRPMLGRVLDTVGDAGFRYPLVLVGYSAEQIESAMGNRCRYVVQPELLGTGDAARVAIDALPAETRRV